MEELRDQFRQRSIESLRKLAVSMREDPTELPPDLFRIIHTIKGTARTFGFRSAAELAHRMEDHLVNMRKVPGKAPESAFVQSIWMLIDLLEETTRSDDAHFKYELSAEESGSPNPGAAMITRIPFETLEQFSDTELARLLDLRHSAILSVMVDFDLADFTGRFRELIEELKQVGEIIATLPAAAASGRIGFNVYFALEGSEDAFDQIAKKYRGTSTLQSAPNGNSDSLQGAVLKIAESALETARELDKKVKLIFAVPENASDIVNIGLIFDVLLHLVNNALDHAFEAEGTLRIGTSLSAGGTSIIVADNGKGLDLEKLKANALTQGIAFNGEKLSDLIFLPGVSTASKVTQTSGRGVGLDAVKTMVEDAGGTIAVESEPGKGTRFEISLPHLQ